MPMTGAFALIF